MGATVPAAQLEQPPDEAGAYMPLAHAVHTADDTAPTMLDAEPAPHPTHTAAPLEDWKVPAGHEEQLLAPEAENVPAAQLAQPDEPVDAWYDPAGHPVQPLEPAAE